MSIIVNKKMIINDIKDVIIKTNNTTQANYSKHGKYCLDSVRKYAGKWQNILKSLNYSINKPNKIDKKEIYQDIKKIIDEYGITTIDFYIKHGKYSKSPIKRLGGWNKILEDLNIKINMHKNITKKDVINDIQKLKEKFGYVNSTIQREYGQYSQIVIDNLFGSFTNLAKIMNLKLDGRFITNDEIKKDIKSLYDKYKLINQNIIKDECIVSPPTIINRFGSLEKLCEELNIPLYFLDNCSKLSRMAIGIATGILQEDPILEHTFEWLVNPRTNKHLRIDAYYPTLNIALEVDGSQHYHFSPLLHKNLERFMKAQYRDNLKNELLKKHNIKLIRIKYNDKIDTIKNKINNIK